MQRAVGEAGVYREAGVDALMVENMHDRPYLRGVALGSEVTAAMTRVACEVRSAVPDLPLGVQVLAGTHTHTHTQHYTIIMVTIIIVYFEGGSLKYLHVHINFLFLCCNLHKWCSMLIRYCKSLHNTVSICIVV